MNIRLLSLLILLLIPCVSQADIQTDGVDDYVQITTTTSNSALRPTPECTMCVWSKRLGANESYGYLFGIPFSDGDSAPYATLAVYSNGASDSEFIAQVDVNGFLYYTTLPATASVFPDTTTWHYVCARTRLVTTIQIDLVVDGVQVSTNSTSGTNIIYDTTSGAGELTIGCESDDRDNCVNHQYAEFTFWNTALTDAELLSIYNARQKLFATQIQASHIIKNIEFDDFPDGQYKSSATFTGTNSLTDNPVSGASSTGVTTIASSALTYP